MLGVERDGLVAGYQPKEEPALFLATPAAFPDFPDQIIGQVIGEPVRIFRDDFDVAFTHANLFF